MTPLFIELVFPKTTYDQAVYHHQEARVWILTNGLLNADLSGVVHSPHYKGQKPPAILRDEWIARTEEPEWHTSVDFRPNMPQTDLLTATGIAVVFATLKQLSLPSLPAIDGCKWVEWFAMKDAPRNASEITVRADDGSTLVAHWAEGDGENQPPFRGWFQDRGTFFEQIDNPVAWRPIEQDEQSTPQKIGRCNKPWREGGEPCQLLPGHTGNCIPF